MRRFHWNDAELWQRAAMIGKHNQTLTFALKVNQYPDASESGGASEDRSQDRSWRRRAAPAPSAVTRFRGALCAATYGIPRIGRHLRAAAPKPPEIDARFRPQGRRERSACLLA